MDLLFYIEFLHRAVDLTLVPSAAIGRDLEAAQVTTANKIRLWNKGVDSESVHPRIAFTGDGPYR
ncbi:hypothetical protein SESBI_41687 [Sesbania bispinosa]|nr:hypothetical protein SESBI_41687 [Sesbania bispinosa]